MAEDGGERSPPPSVDLLLAAVEQSETQQKELDAEAKLASERNETLEDVLRPMTVSFALNLFSWLMMIPVRPEMVLKATGQDAAKATKILAGMTTGASLVEFLATPLLGRLSDRFGRRPLLLAAPAACIAARLCTYAGASHGSLRAVVLSNWFDRCLSGSMYPLFGTIGRASLTDVVLGDELAKALASLAAPAGIAVVAGPFVGGAIMHATGKPRATALASAAVSALHLAYVYRRFRETLPAEASGPA